MPFSPRKMQLLRHLADCVLSVTSKGIIFRDESGIHIDPFYLVDDDPVRQTVVELITDEILFEKVQNLAGFMKSGQVLASILASKFEMPLYCYSLQSKEAHNDEPAIKFREANNFTIIIGYTSTQEQVAEAISKIEKQGAVVVQIISLIDEANGAKVVAEKKDINFVSLLTLSEIKETISSRIEELKNRIAFIENYLKKGELREIAP